MTFVLRFGITLFQINFLRVVNIILLKVILCTVVDSLVSKKSLFFMAILVSFLLVSSGVYILLNQETQSPVSDGETIIVESSDGSNVKKIKVKVANTQTERYIGLSNHTNLKDGHGMLFVYPSEEPRSFVMRDMEFGIDIVFIGLNCRIKSIYTASPPNNNETGTEPWHTYKGDAMYVLETNLGEISDEFDKGSRVENLGCNT